MPQSFASLHCHIVFSTKHREPTIEPEIQPRLFEYIGGILRNHSCRLIAAGGIPDHVHLLVSLGRTLAVAEAVRLIKSNSSNWLHEELALPDFRWQTGYGAFAVSYSNSDTGEIVSGQPGTTPPPLVIPGRVPRITPPAQSGMGRKIRLGLSLRQPQRGARK